VKNRSWLNITEYLMLLGSGVGSIATAVSQQSLYTAAPVTALLVLNLLNHRRMARNAQAQTAIAVSELDQKLAHNLANLQQQIYALPSPIHLASLRKELQKQHQQAFIELSQAIQILQREIPRTEQQLAQDIYQLHNQYESLANTVMELREACQRIGSTHRVETVEETLGQLKVGLAQLRTQLQTLSSDHKLANYRALQDQINHLNRRFNQLPIQVDASGLEQDIEALIHVVSDMASRRDVTRVEAQCEKLNRQNQALMTTVRALEDRVYQLPNPSSLSNLGTFQRDLEPLIATCLGPLKQQLDAVQQQTQELATQQQTLQDWVHRLPQLLDSQTQEVKYLATRVEWAESNVIDLQSQVAANRGPMSDYELVFDVKSRSQEPVHRSMVEDALAQVQARLILVLPSPSPNTLDEAMFERFRQFLDRKGCLDLGWGYLGEGCKNGISPWKMHRSRWIDQHRASNLSGTENASGTNNPAGGMNGSGAGNASNPTSPSGSQFLQDTLNRLTELKKDYPERLRFKVLGTEESFLVCDRAFAVVGMPSVATTSVVFPSATVGLCTTEPEVIQQLVTRFDQPTLTCQDVAAYFNRAETRFDLGDRQGAIADYTEVLAIHPTDDVTYNNRGLAHYHLGNKDKALQDFNHALEYHSQNVAAYCNRGIIQAELGNKQSAIQDYTQALQFQPDCTTAFFYRGLAYTQTQNHLEAIHDYNHVIQLAPQDAPAYFYRGLTTAKLGQTLEAAQDLRQAAQLFAAQGDSANYRQALNYLKKLQKNFVMDSTGKSLVTNQAI
jgi:tetratricopeptide (TPR) repeat protein